MLTTNLIEQSSHLADHASQSAAQALRASRRAADGALQGVSDAARNASRHLRYSIRDDPLAAVLIALTAGVALAGLVGLLGYWRTRD